MSSSRKYDSFIFTHIPKCGGTSFRRYINEAALNSNLAPEHLYIPGFNKIPDEKNLSKLSEEEIQQVQQKEIKILANHSKFREHESYHIHIPKPFRYTILRAPVERFVSHYNYFNYKLGYNDCKDIELKDLPSDKLEEILLKFSNLQSIYLSNHPYPKQLGQEYLLKIAKFNLIHEYHAFGILEQLPLSVQMLQKVAPKWLKLEKDFPVLNTNKSSLNYSPKLIQTIEDYNQNDIELYEFAQSYFDHKVTQHKMREHASPFV